MSDLSQIIDKRLEVLLSVGSYSAGCPHPVWQFDEEVYVCGLHPEHGLRCTECQFDHDDAHVGVCDRCASVDRTRPMPGSVVSLSAQVLPPGAWTSRRVPADPTNPPGPQRLVQISSLLTVCGDVFCRKAAEIAMQEAHERVPQFGAHTTDG